MVQERDSKRDAHPRRQCGGGITYHFGLEGWLHLPLLQQSPINGLEEGVGFDVSCHSQPLLWVSFKQLKPSKSSG